MVGLLLCMFEVPQRQQLASERTSLTLFAPAPSTISFVPLTRNLSLADPSPYPGVDRPLRGNCHPLFCAPDNQVRCVFGSAPYQKQASTVRNTHSVLKKASWGTRRIFRSIRCKKQAFLVREGYAVPETPSYGTRCIFKGQQNSRLHKLWTASCRTGRIFSARNDPLACEQT